MLILHVFIFFAVFIVLWVMGDKAPNDETFFQFDDWSGWGSVGIATMIGSGVAATATLGSDSSAHLAEELKDASWVLPRSMAVTAAVNYLLCFLMVGRLPCIAIVECGMLMIPDHHVYVRQRRNS